eukprot:1129895-Alexandrium_andersonii.AAC.1
MSASPLLTLTAPNLPVNCTGGSKTRTTFLAEKVFFASHMSTPVAASGVLGFALCPNRYAVNVPTLCCSTYPGDLNCVPGSTTK